MGQSPSALIQIANAYSQDVWVKVDVDVPRALHVSRTANANASAVQVGNLLNLSANVSSDETAEYHRLHEAGFSKMPRYEVSPFKPPSEASNSQTVYVSMYYLEDGEPKHLHVNKSQEKFSSLIITRHGGLVKAKSDKSPWIGLDDHDHGAGRCELCEVEKKTCQFCFTDTRWMHVQNSIVAMTHCQLLQKFSKLIEDMQAKNICKKNKEGGQMLKKVEELSQKYRALKTITTGVVQDVQVYGRDVYDAVGDFLEDGEWPDFLQQVRDLGPLQNSLEVAYKEHSQIQRDVSKLYGEAQDKSKSYKEKREAVGAKIDYSDYIWISFLPVHPQLFLAAAVVNVVTLPFFWIREAVRRDYKAYSDLTEDFEDIAKQLLQVDAHLTIIIGCVEEIQHKFKEGLKTERNLIRATNQRKRRRMAERAGARAKELVQVCEKYRQAIKVSTLTPMDNGQQTEAAAIEG